MCWIMKSIATLFYFFVLLFLQPLWSQSLAINEVLSSNPSVNADEDGNYEDWVEIYNYGGSPINMNGYGLSDEAALPFKWAFPNITLNAGQYLLVWCSDKNRITVGNPLHTNFKISATGETIRLTSPSSVTVSTMPAVALQPNVSYGKSPNGTGSYFYFATPTPGLPNTTTAYAEALNPPTFSQLSGFYTTGFSLSLSSTTPGTTIIYTLDGSDPDENNLAGTTYSYKNSYAELAGQSGGPLLQNSFRSFAYSSPIAIVNRSAQANKLAAMSSTQHHTPDYIPTTPIFKGTVVRAKVIKPGALPSKVASRTYFITPAGSSEFSLPVASISISENKLFNYTNGIFVAGLLFDNWRMANPTVDSDIYENNFDANYHVSGDPSERSGNITYLVNGTEVVNQDVGLRINGDSSRGWQSKSFRLVARGEYGNDALNYTFFNDTPVSVFNRLILRNSGGDFFDTMYRDAFAQELVKGTGLETQAYQPTITFVNGEYWGILNLRERYDKYYFKNLYDIGETQLDLLEDDLTPSEGDAVHYNNMATYLTNNSLAIQANFDYIKTQMDVDNMRDYYIANIYYDNVDWPGWNTVFWRKKTAAYVPNALYGQDGRWRAAMKDNDDCFGMTTGILNHNNLAVATAPNGPDYPNPPSSTLILRSLLANPSFKNNFINRFADLMNTYFLPSRYTAVSNAMKARIQPEMQEHLNRWKATDYAWWETAINNMNNFGNVRPAFQRQHIRAKFGISSDITATLNVSDMAHGYIKMNTVDILESTPGVSANPYPWTGIYFHNIPVTLKAIPLSGYQFSHWSGASTSTNAEITITPTANFSVTAHFTPSGNNNPPQVIYYWMMDTALANDTPLTAINSTYELNPEGVLQYQSCLVGYPFTSIHPSWRKASMERRNSPTPLNYIPQANGGKEYAFSDMRGLQIKQPFQSGGLQNTLVFNFSTTGYQNIKFALAALDEGAATGITIDYATNAGAPVWTTAGMSASSYPITNAYQRIETDFTPIAAVNNNPNFKIRIRFTGPNMTADTGARVTFNNFSVEGVPTTLSVPENLLPEFLVYPNPVNEVLHLMHNYETVAYTLFALDGRTIEKGKLNNQEINVATLPSGVYLLRLQTEDKTAVRKFIKR